MIVFFDLVFETANMNKGFLISAVMLDETEALTFVEELYSSC